MNEARVQGEAVRDLGALDGSVLVFGGPVSNLEVTRAVLEAARTHGVAADHTICTGDVVAYCADSEATVEAVRAAGIHVIMGNCEESFGAGADDCGCSFNDGSACDLLARQWYAYADAQLSVDSRAWMRALPHAIRFELGGRRLMAVHGAPSRINRWIFPSTPANEKRSELDLAGVDGIIGGHSGIPFVEELDGRLWLNAGSVGLPANDGTPRGWYALLRPEDGGVGVALRALRYDHGTAAAKMREAALPEGYAAALETGLWPSLDILPPAERASTGRPLAAERSFLWRMEAGTAARRVS